MKTGPGSGFEMTKLVPKDKPENYSPHTSVSDYLPPRDAGVRTPINGNVEHIDYSKFDVPRAVRESIPAMLCTCRQDTHAICRLHPLRITEEIDYSKFPPPDEQRVQSTWSMPAGATISFHEGKQPKHAETVCEEANRIVYGDREKTYGHPAKNFDCTAALWQAYLDHRTSGPLNARDVARLMVLLKLARQMHMHKRDNLVDGIGYFACEAKIDDYEG